MPPSGYNNLQAESICTFLRSCVSELIQENQDIRNSNSAIKREMDSITQDLAQEKRQEFEFHLLVLTREFYNALLKGCPEQLDELADYAETLLSDFRLRILDIHVIT